MNIQALKIDIIHWLTELNDERVLEKIQGIKEEVENAVLTSEQEKELDMRLKNLSNGTVGIKDNPTSFNDLATRILVGVNKALRKLAENAAANNEELIVSDKDGNIKSVPAKELLRNLEETEKA